MHFSVLVIGDNVDSQLEPYYQDLEVDEYLVDEVTNYDKQRILDFYREHKKEEFESFDDCYAKYGDDWNSNAYRKDADGIWREYSTYNLDAQWDCYEIGGRWAGKIVVKEDVEYYSSPNFSWGWSEENKKKITRERRTDTALIKDIKNLNELSCYAIVQDYEWINNDKLEGFDNNEVMDILSKLDPNTRITFVDCHM